METIINDFVSAPLEIKAVLVFYGVCVASFYGTLLYAASLFASHALKKVYTFML